MTARQFLSYLHISKHICALTLASVTMAASSAVAQTAAGQSGTAETKPLAYDVASIKVNKSDSGNSGFNWNSNKYSATNVTLKNLVSDAYGIKEDYIYDVPSWANSARFDLEAKILDADVRGLDKLTPKQRQSLMKPVLADRFQFKAHTETRTLPVYEMGPAKGGPKLKPTSSSDSSGEGWSGGDGVFTAHSVPMAGLANFLSSELHRTVLDSTGLAGKFDFELKWTAESGPDASAEASTASIFTALEEQLGLKLRSSKGPVEVLVVEHAELPSEN